MELLHSSGSALHPCGTASVVTEAGRTVVSLFGDHDISTVPLLSLMLARTDGGEGDLVIDLSGVVFMDASTIGVIVRAKSLLLTASRSLTVRAPSAFAGFVLEQCQLSDFVDAGPLDSPQVLGALASWIKVPTRGNIPVDHVTFDRLMEGPLDVPQRGGSTAIDVTPSSDGEPLGVPRGLLHGVG